MSKMFTAFHEWYLRQNSTPSVGHDRTAPGGSYGDEGYQQTVYTKQSGMGKLPYPGGRGSRIWDGESETFSDHVKWFENLAEEHNLAAEKWVESYIEYVKPAKRAVLEAISDHTWESFKGLLMRKYKSRRDHHPISTTELANWAAKWSSSDVIIAEDLTKRWEEFVVIKKRVRQVFTGDAGDRLLDSTLFDSLTTSQKETAFNELGNSGITWDEDAYPKHSDLFALLEKWVSVSNESRNNIRESKYPGMAKAGDLAKAAEERYQESLERLLGPKKYQVVYKNDDQAKSTSSDVLAPKVVVPPPSSANEVDSLVDRLRTLNINAVRGLTTTAYAEAEADYRSCRARLVGVSPICAASYPAELSALAPKPKVVPTATTVGVSSLGVEPDASEDGIYAEVCRLATVAATDADKSVWQSMSELMSTHRGRYREQPEWRELHARAVARNPDFGALTQLTPMTPGSGGPRRNGVRC
ncbi:hypothetical protein IAT38_003565 [Cryptococcus sp. DSM 104549]